MVPASASVLMVERAPKNGCCQHLCPHGDSQLPLASLEVLQDQQVCLMHVPFILFPLHLFSGCVRCCVCLLRAESLFPTALRLSCMQALLDFKATCSRSSSSWSSTPVGKACCGALTPYPLGRTSAIMIILPFMGCLSQKFGS